VRPSGLVSYKFHPAAWGAPGPAIDMETPGMKARREAAWREAHPPQPVGPAKPQAYFNDYAARRQAQVAEAEARAARGEDHEFHNYRKQITVPKRRG